MNLIVCMNSLDIVSYFYQDSGSLPDTQGNMYQPIFEAGFSNSSITGKKRVEF